MTQVATCPNCKISIWLEILFSFQEYALSPMFLATSLIIGSWHYFDYGSGPILL